MSFGIKVLGTRGAVQAESAQFTVGSARQKAFWGQVVTLPMGDGALLVQLFDDDDQETGRVTIDLHTVAPNSSDWFDLSNGSGSVQLNFEAVGGAVAMDDDPFGAPVASGSGFQQVDSEEEEEEEESEEEEEEHSSEPTPLMLWQEKHNAELIERATAARAKRDERKTGARDWLKKFYEDRDGKLTAKQKLNRQQNQALVDKITANLGYGQIWERVSNLINMGASSAGRKDVARMRSVLLQVKNSTPAHLARHDAVPAGGRGGASGSADLF